MSGVIRRGCFAPSVLLLALAGMGISACAGLTGKICFTPEEESEQDTRPVPEQVEAPTGLELFP